MIEVPKLSENKDYPPGRQPLPHVDSFIAKYQASSESYLARFDEALWDNPENAFRMRLDPTIMDPLRTRQRSIVSLSWHIDPEDDQDDRQVAAAAAIEKRIRRLPQLASFLMSLKEDVWYGRSASQVMYRWEQVDRIWGITPSASIPVNGDKLVYFWNGDVGLRVSSTYKGKTEPTDYGLVHKLTPDEREAFVVGIFEPEDSDYRKPWKGGAIKGLGLRERLYWFWGLKNQAMKMLADFLQWFAQGLTVYYYDGHNADAKAEAIQRITQYQGVPFIVWPHFGDDRLNMRPVERIQADGTASQFLMNYIEYLDRVIRSMILGQTLSTSTGATGMGSGVAMAHLITSDQVVKYDAFTTQDYLSTDMVRTMYEYTYPGMPPGRWVFEIDSPNVDQLTSSIDIFTRLGGKVGSETLRKELGIPDLKPNETPLGVIDTLDPTAAAGTPTDTPIQKPAEQQTNAQG